MGATKPKKHSKKQRKHGISESSTSSNPTALLSQASSLLQTGDAPAALPLAQKAAELLSAQGASSVKALPAFALLGEINVELGEPEVAREAFIAAAKIDPQGKMEEDAGGGPQKFLWLAQLSEEGGHESVGWYQKGVESLVLRIGELEDKEGNEEEIEDKKRKIATALCGMIEVWMTDLALEEEAETQCESLITKAMMVSDPPHPSTLQTLASIRLSQNKLEDAESALNRSLELWKDLPADHPDKPDFPTRISLARLLMEAGMEERALEVVEVLVGEDDQSIEAWYLGGWCLHLMASSTDAQSDEEKKGRQSLLLSSREWLRNCLKLYELLEYEDERLRDHAKELVAEMDKELGDIEIDEEDEEWEDEDASSQDGDGDHDMNGT